MKNNFKDAVSATPDISKCFQNGLHAMGKHSVVVKLGNPRLCNGSVDIDTCTTSKYPSQNRWDYVFGYKSEAFFVEVHSANTGEVSTVLRKVQWLKDWLHSQAPKLNKIKAKNHPFYWIQSNGFHILKSSSQYRQIVAKGLHPIKILELP